MECVSQRNNVSNNTRKYNPYQMFPVSYAREDQYHMSEFRGDSLATSPAPTVTTMVSPFL